VKVPARAGSVERGDRATGSAYEAVTHEYPQALSLLIENTRTESKFLKSGVPGFGACRLGDRNFWIWPDGQISGVRLGCLGRGLFAAVALNRLA
jgi:hypothetical protein